MTNDELAAQLRLAADILEGKTAVQKPAFQLPTPPPGMHWHRTNGWTSEMLPQGTRPLCNNETVVKGDEFNAMGAGSFRLWEYHALFQVDDGFWHYRTTRPLTFTHEGHEWTWHRAGAPMPCDGNARIFIIGIDGRTVARDGSMLVERSARSNRWDSTLGWRYADTLQSIYGFAKDQVNATPEIQDAVGQVLAEELQTDPYAELKKAHAEGKVIQALIGGAWSDCHYPTFSYPLDTYRIKPDEIPWIEWNGGECPLKDEEAEEWEYKYRDGGIEQLHPLPSVLLWKHLKSNSDIIAYRRVLKWREKKPKKTVPLGPEDVPPGSVFRHMEFKPGIYLSPSLVQSNGVCWIRKNMIVDGCSMEFIPFDHLIQSWQINRSIPLAGKWNPDAWEACEK